MTAGILKQDVKKHEKLKEHCKDKTQPANFWDNIAQPKSR